MLSELMWLIGHTAAAYLIIKIAWYAKYTKKEDPGPSKDGRDSRRGERPKNAYQFPPYFLLLLFVFANWPDFFHAGDIRIFSHNTIAVLVVPIIILIFMVQRRIMDRTEAFFLFWASVIHMITDIGFSSFYPFYPFDDSYVNIFLFNSLQNIMAEVILSVPFLLIFIASKDWKDLAAFLENNLVNPQREMKPVDQLPVFRYMNIFIFLAFSLFSLLQLILYSIRLSLGSHFPADFFSITLFITFTCFIAVLTMVFFSFTIGAQKKYVNSIPE